MDRESFFLKGILEDGLSFDGEPWLLEEVVSGMISKEEVEGLGEFLGL